MTPPDFSVLLLAWDEADPSVAVLGGAALPPTLPLVYRLATEQPVLAVYPHLPIAADPGPEARPNPAKTSKKSRKDAAQADEPTAGPPAPPLPGVRTLPPPAQANGVPSLPGTSRLVGLLDLTPASTAQLQAALLPPATGPQLTDAARSQWPTGVHAPPPQPWQAPAAPYAGASAGQVAEPASAPAAAPVLPVAPARPSPSVREAADLANAALAAPATPVANTALRAETPQAGNLGFDPDPELPFVRRAVAFSERVEEMGAAEAADLLAPEDDLTPNEWEPAPALDAVLVPSPRPPASAQAPALLIPSLDGLNFRMIQYARQAAQLVRDQAGFEVIYAPNWPAWLAALELRNSTGQPLVLYAASLAADFTSPAERGWLLEIERMTLRRAHLILVPDEDVRQRLQAQYGTTIGEIRVVPAADEPAVREALHSALVR